MTLLSQTHCVACQSVYRCNASLQLIETQIYMKFEVKMLENNVLYNIYSSWLEITNRFKLLKRILRYFHVNGSNSIHIRL